MFKIGGQNIAANFNFEFVGASALPETRHTMCFPLETSRYALVAKAFRYEIAFSMFSEIEFSKNIEKLTKV